MKKEKATIYDFSRMCNSFDRCADCPADYAGCMHLLRENPDKANEIILKWVKEHPIKTRQDEFLKMFPNVRTDKDGVIELSPCVIDEGEFVKEGGYCPESHTAYNCTECRKKYWLEAVDE